MLSLRIWVRQLQYDGLSVAAWASTDTSNVSILPLPFTSVSPRDSQTAKASRARRTSSAKAASQWILSPAGLHIRDAVLTVSP